MNNNNPNLNAKYEEAYKIEQTQDQGPCVMHACVCMGREEIYKARRV